MADAIKVVIAWGTAAMSLPQPRNKLTSHMDTTTIKALRVIEALSDSAEPRGVAELGRQVGLTQSNTFRILSTLASQGYVTSLPDSGRYSLSLKVWELGMKVIDRHLVRRAAPTHLKQLYSQLTETILLSELDEAEVLYVEKIESDYPVRASARIGSRAPAWRTASGLAMLSFYPEGEVMARLARVNLDAARCEEILTKLREFRMRGYASSIGGTRPGVNSIAAPIWGRPASANPIAAVSVSGPTERFSVARMGSIATAVMNTATRITESLGSSHPIFPEDHFSPVVSMDHTHEATR